MKNRSFTKLTFLSLMILLLNSAAAKGENLVQMLVESGQKHPISETTGEEIEFNFTNGYHPVLNGHPRLLAKTSDREAMLNKIKKCDWAAQSYAKMCEEVDPIADRHLKDPAWVMSRMQMFWEKHYTTFPSFGGTEYMYYGQKIVNNGSCLDLKKRSGQAPVPTVRVSGYNNFYTKAGGMAKQPKLENFPTYYSNDVYAVIDVDHPEVSDSIPLGTRVHDWNRVLAELAYKSSALYFVTEDEKYARLASDLLMQWTLGIYFQNGFNDPETGPKTSNCFLGSQDLYDRPFKVWGAVYDFCYDYLQKNSNHYLSGDFYSNSKYIDKQALKKSLDGKSLTGVVEAAFYKFMTKGILARTYVGKPNESVNNHCIWSSEIMWMALAIDNKEKREKCLNYFLYNDSLCHPEGKGIFASWLGALSWSTVLKNTFTKEGFWPEPVAYHQAPMRSVALTSVVLDNCGYKPWENFPEVSKGSVAQFPLAFPSGYLIAFGDDHRCLPDASTLEFAYSGAVRAGLATAPVMASYLNKMITAGQHKRSAGVTELFYWQDTIPQKTPSVKDLPRTDSVGYAHTFIQRNAVDSEYGLMLQVGGGNYTHSHKSGMTMECYGLGWVMGPNSGAKYPYGSKIMMEYYVKGGSKNSVVPNNMNGNPNVKCLVMEPIARQEAVSPYCSFIETTADFGSKLGQRRLLSLIRTSPTTGYYLDIFRSGNEVKNEYRYHNIGQSVSLLDEKEQEVALESSHQLESKEIGDQYLKNEKSVGGIAGTLHAKFEMKDFKKNRDLNMNLYLLGSSDYKYYTVMAPAATAADAPYDDNSLKYPRPGFYVNREGEAWTKPFVALLEPSLKNDSHIKKVRNLLTSENKAGKVAICVEGKDTKQGTQYHFSSLDKAPFATEGINFSGTYAVVDKKAGSLHYLYLGSGVELACEGYAIQSSNENPISANLTVENGELTISSTKPFKVQIRYPKSKLTADVKKTVLYLKSENGNKVACSMAGFKNFSNEEVILWGNFNTATKGQIIVGQE